MKALSIRQPWAYKILRGAKKVEYRTWATEYRGPLLICTSLTWDENGKKKPDPQTLRVKYPQGVAYCVVDLTDIKSELVEHPWYDDRKQLYCEWYLANPRPVKQFPVKGRLHLFDVPDKLIEMI